MSPGVLLILLSSCVLFGKEKTTQSIEFYLNGCGWVSHWAPRCGHRISWVWLSFLCPRVFQHLSLPASLEERATSKSNTWTWNSCLSCPLSQEFQQQLGNHSGPAYLYPFVWRLSGPTQRKHGASGEKPGPHPWEHSDVFFFSLSLSLKDLIYF